MSVLASIVTASVFALYLALEARAARSQAPAPDPGPDPHPLAPEPPADPYRTPGECAAEASLGAPLPTPRRGRWTTCPFCGSDSIGAKFETCKDLTCRFQGQPHVDQRCIRCTVNLGAILPTEEVIWR